jgi:hypothetical protein
MMGKTVELWIDQGATRITPRNDDGGVVLVKKKLGPNCPVSLRLKPGNQYTPYIDFDSLYSFSLSLFRHKFIVRSLCCVSIQSAQILAHLPAPSFSWPSTRQSIQVDENLHWADWMRGEVT